MPTGQTDVITFPLDAASIIISLLLGGGFCHPCMVGLDIAYLCAKNMTIFASAVSRYDW